MRKLIVSLILILSVGFFGFAAIAISQDQDVAGTFFGNPIPRGNYYFVLKVVLSFNSPWGGIPNNREQLEKRVWDDLILSYEAHQRRIPIEKKEVDEKISETLKGSKASFNWREDEEAYAQWTKDTLGVSIEIFENQMRHLVQIKKLCDQVMDSVNTSVTEDEAIQEFRNEQNNLSVEVVEFDELEEAQKFYQSATADPLFWKQEVKKDKEKERGERSFRRPGFVTLEFLMNMWGFPKDAVYEMIEMNIGDVYPPTPIYEGYGVYKILDIRRADESLLPNYRESLFNQLRSRKKYHGFNEWLEELRDEADIQVYIDPPAEIFP